METKKVTDIVTFLQNFGRPGILDGGFGMQLAKNGAHIDGDPLWSSRLLLTNPAAIEFVHLQFLNCGAEIIETCTYQASFESLSKHCGLSSADVEALFSKAVSLARNAASTVSRRRLVAGSLGPYGAFLADRSEYTGAYIDTVDASVLKNFHLKRIGALVNAKVDYVAFETIPLVKEAEVLLQIMKENFSAEPFSLTFSTHDGLLTPRGESIVQFLKKSFQDGLLSNAVAVGVNCCQISSATAFLKSVSSDAELDGLRIIVYPNLDEEIDSINRDSFWKAVVSEWISIVSTGKCSLVAIGGCCNVFAQDVNFYGRVVMTTVRPMQCLDILKFNNVNFDRFTETYGVGYYMHYLARWPEYCIVAEAPSGTIMGYIIGKDEGRDENWHGHVTALTVAPEFRRLGIARRLMAMLEKISDGKGCYFVDLFVRAKNENAIAMYKQLGYTVYRRVINYYTGDQDEDALDMRKALAADVDHKSVIPLPHPVQADDVD